MSSKKQNRFSLLALKLLAEAVAAGAILCIVISAAGYRHFKKVFERQYYHTNLEFAYIASSYINGDELAGYLEKRKLDDEWQTLKDKLTEITNVADFESLTVTIPDTMSYEFQSYVFHCVNARIAEKTKIYTIIAPEYLANQAKSKILKIKKLMMLGRSYTEYTYDSTGGLASTSIPIRDSYNNIVGMLTVTKSMNEVLAQQSNYQHQIVLIALIGGIIFILLYGASLIFQFVRPIITITQETEYFSQNGKLSGNLSKIKNRDEIGGLSKAVEKMSDEIKNYINKLTTVTAEKERISTELNVATKIQADMLPRIYPPFPGREDFDLFASMDPAKEVGGDLYDYLLLDDDHLMVVVGDVSGKGVPAALFMVIAKTLLDSHSTQRLSPAEIFTVTNLQLCSGNDSGLFVTCWLGIITLSSGELTYVNAGHTYPILFHNNEFSYIRTKVNFVLGGMEETKYQEHTIKLEKGDRLFIYTDGVTEAINSKEEGFGEDRLLKAIEKTREMTAPECLKSVRESLDEFVGGAEQFDDITMLDLILK